MSGPRTIQNLEIHVAHGCNLTCESCSHYSNQGHKGLLSPDEADRWMGAWAGRLRPRVFTLLGGEPTIHPDLTAFVPLARRHWPGALLRLVTNGFFLHRHPELPAALKSADGVLRLSIHHDSPEYREKLWPVCELLTGWVRAHGVRVEVLESFRDWTRRYHGFGAAMEPFAEGRPWQSWENCPARFRRQLFEGEVWKCAPLAYLGLQDARHGLSDKWRPYLAYRPLDPGCTDEELNAFFDREDEPFCGMCAAEPRRMELPSPLVPLGRLLARPA